MYKIIMQAPNYNTTSSLPMFKPHNIRRVPSNSYNINITYNSIYSSFKFEIHPIYLQFILTSLNFIPLKSIKTSNAPQLKV